MKIFLISLGCDKNLVDSEKMLGILSKRGYEFTDDEEDADIIILNTCCFIGDAQEESISEIERLAGYKREGKLKLLVLAGCLAQRYQDQIFDEYPEVDDIIGTMSIESIDRVIEESLRKKESGDDERISKYDPLDSKPYSSPVRSITTGGHYAYLKIAEGCDKRCTYCVIPYVRGPYRSVPMDDLLTEALMLAEKGVRELILVAQETTVYGTDIYGKKCLPELLRKLCAIDGFEWIRILYAYPEEIDDELIDVIASEKKICNYLDIPIQHCNDKILARMGRKTKKSSIEALIGKLREKVPGIALRTSLITGFPGETQEDFEELYRFVNECEFERLGVFTYSCDEETPSAHFDGRVPEDIAEKRRDEIMELEQAVIFDLNDSHVGEKLQVLIEGFLPDEGVYVGRTYRDAPDVDGLFFLESERELMTGDIVSAEVKESRGYDLFGILINE